VLAAHAERDVEARAGDGRGAGPGDHHPHPFELLAGQVRGVEQRGAGDDGGAVLVVVEDRDLHLLLEPLLDQEAVRRLDVLEVDAAEGRLERAHDRADLVDLPGGDLEIEDVDVGEALEEHALALHHRLARVRTDVPEAEHGRAVRDHGDQVAARGVGVGQVLVAGDLQARLGDAGGVGEREVPRRRAGLGGDDLDLSLATALVKGEGILAADLLARRQRIGGRGREVGGHVERAHASHRPIAPPAHVGSREDGVDAA
jgi:hypothetical protein